MRDDVESLADGEVTVGEFVMRRAEAVSRRTRARATVRLMPTKLLRGRPLAERRAVAAELAALLRGGRDAAGPRGLGLQAEADGELALHPYWAQWYDAVWEGGPWEVDGEVRVDPVRYDWKVEPV